MIRYNPAAWYWIVAGDSSKVWSSAAAAYVATSDATYVAWLASGGLATKIDTEASLQQVLAAAYPPGWPGGDLASRIAAGCQIVSTATAALSGTYPLDLEHLFYITSISASLAEGAGLPQDAATVAIPDLAGAPHLFNATDFVNLAKALRDYFASLKATSHALAAGVAMNWPAQPVTIP
jgi:hypothetical protein